jgi:uncharacterized protein YcgL (UPF0745 family)
MHGNERLQKPNYDSIRFDNTIPTNVILLELDSEQKIPQQEIEEVKPLFENSFWL